MSSSQQRFFANGDTIMVVKEIHANKVSPAQLLELIKKRFVTPTLKLGNACIASGDAALLEVVLANCKHGWALGTSILDETEKSSVNISKLVKCQRAILTRVHEIGLGTRALEAAPRSWTQSWRRHYDIKYTLNEGPPMQTAACLAPDERIQKEIRRWGVTLLAGKDKRQMQMETMAAAWVRMIVLRCREKDPQHLMDMIRCHLAKRDACWRVSSVAVAMVRAHAMCQGMKQLPAIIFASFAGTHVSTVGQFEFARRLIPHFLAATVQIEFLLYLCVKHANVDWLTAVLSCGHIPAEMCERALLCATNMQRDSSVPERLVYAQNAIIRVLQATGAGGATTVQNATTSAVVLAVLVRDNLISRRAAFEVVRSGSVNPRTLLANVPFDEKVVLQRKETCWLVRELLSLVMSSPERASAVAFICCMRARAALDEDENRKRRCTAAARLRKKRRTSLSRSPATWPQDGDGAVIDADISLFRKTIVCRDTEVYAALPPELVKEIVMNTGRVYSALPISALQRLVRTYVVTDGVIY